MTVQITAITEDDIRQFTSNVIFLSHNNYDIYDYICTILNCNMTNKQAIALHRFMSMVDRACDDIFQQTVH